MRFDSSLCDNYSFVIKLLILASSVRENRKVSELKNF